MSFILDALRKSEHERERRQSPGLAAAPVASSQRSRLPLLLGGVGALLAVNMVVLLALYARGGPETAELPVMPAAGAVATGAPHAAGATTPPAAGETATVAAAAREVRSLADEAANGYGAAPDFDYPEPPPLHRGDWPRVAAIDAGPTLATPPMPGDGRIGLAQPPRGAAAAGAAAAPWAPGGSGSVAFPPGTAPPNVRGSTIGTGGLPTIDDLTPQATAGLPALALNLHVWSTEPSQRFVVLDGESYREGSQLAAGPILERITPEGAVLNHNGLRFLLPRD